MLKPSSVFQIILKSRFLTHLKVWKTKYTNNHESCVISHAHDDYRWNILYARSRHRLESEHFIVRCCNLMKSNKSRRYYCIRWLMLKSNLFERKFRIDGMGQTTGRFRDKLAMRMRAKSCGIPILLFCSCLTITTLILCWYRFALGFKPRSSDQNYHKVFDKETFMAINEMGNNRFKYLLEQSNQVLFIIVIAQF
jgi:hypothetical protein